MGLFDKFKAGLQKTHNKLAHEIKRIVTRSPRLETASLEELEAALIGADLGMKVTAQIVAAVKRAYETQGGSGLDVFAIAAREVAGSLASNRAELTRAPQGPTVVSVVGVNGTGKTTTIGKLAHRLRADSRRVLLAAADTFRAAAADQLEIWAGRSGADLVRHREGADPAAVVYDAAQAARARHADVLIVDTAGRLHTKVNLIEELKKMDRVVRRELPGSPVEALLVIDATTGQNGLAQAREFKAAVPLTGVVLTKLDGTARGGIVVPITQELGVPVKLVGLGEGIDDLEPFDPEAFADALLTPAAAPPGEGPRASA